ncbi:hypothetical protein C8035_v002132 [Colletotrichum spinosum]|uniref:Uncharacterized protein n=1 Tax=Colletotrichum spinosum TaxID=1347390 RepID=A0A4R8QRG9_9PEZI|nr:hypothetical protein C8035_v002132 [Colletotrichum spinosum]
MRDQGVSDGTGEKGRIVGFEQNGKPVVWELDPENWVGLSRSESAKAGKAGTKTRGDGPNGLVVGLVWFGLVLELGVESTGGIPQPWEGGPWTLGPGNVDLGPLPLSSWRTSSDGAWPSKRPRDN